MSDIWGIKKIIEKEGGERPKRNRKRINKKDDKELAKEASIQSTQDY